MGSFTYGPWSTVVAFDDRLLAHLRVVILAKLRRSESFAFSWNYGLSSGSGSSSVWLNPAIPIQFDFLGSKEPRINRYWVDELMKLANSPGGLRVVTEPTEPAES